MLPRQRPQRTHSVSSPVPALGPAATHTLTTTQAHTRAMTRHRVQSSRRRNAENCRCVEDARMADRPCSHVRPRSTHMVPFSTVPCMPLHTAMLGGAHGEFSMSLPLRRTPMSSCCVLPCYTCAHGPCCVVMAHLRQYRLVTRWQSWTQSTYHGILSHTVLTVPVP